MAPLDSESKPDFSWYVYLFTYLPNYLPNYQTIYLSICSVVLSLPIQTRTQYIYKIQSMAAHRRDYEPSIFRFFDAVANNDVSSMTYELKGGNVKRSDCNTALCLAAQEGALEAVKFLACIPSVDRAFDDNCALNAAVEAGYLEIVKYLVGFNDIFDSSSSGNPWAHNKALRLAVKKNHTEIARLLLELPQATREFRNGCDLFVEAIINCNMEMLCMLADHFRANIEAHFRETDGYFSAFLATAAYHGHLDMVQYLMETPWIRMAANGSALQQAARRGHTAIVDYLVMERWGPSTRTDLNKALVLAAEHGHLDTVKILAQTTQHQQDASVDDQRLLPAMRSACQNDHVEVLKFLFEMHRSQVGSSGGVTTYGDYLLQTSASYNKTEVVRYLATQPEVDVAAYGNAAVIWAGVYQNEAMAMLLLEFPEVNRDHSIFYRLECRQYWRKMLAARLEKVEAMTNMCIALGMPLDTVFAIMSVLY
jgi:ankyrin repeat protein